MDLYNNDSWPSPPNDDFSDDGMPIDPISSMADVPESTFEPQGRARSNTWPLPRPENFVEPTEDGENTNGINNGQLVTGIPPTPTSISSAAAKKNSSRRNAWGNLSYADLITKAITTAPESRLTLSQIYEWMVQNVPYFKDKGDSNSSAGWKNSIRHNLSLHNRFMRVQNEGTGKSSWWMLNPDAKPGKSVRRRATSMETSKFEKRRGRVKKRVEQIRSGAVAHVVGVLNDLNSSPGSSVSEGLDLFPDSPLHSGNFQLSPDFRQRASSNASSLGRLSPIPAVDWSFDDDDIPDYESDGTGTENPQTIKVEKLADDLSLQNLQGFSTASNLHHSHPPPPYQPPQYQSVHSQQFMMSQPQTIQMMQHQNNTRESMSPGSINGMSPSYGEQSPDYSRIQPASNSPPTTPDSQMMENSLIENNSPQTLMGQFMGALNGQTNLDDLSLNLEAFQGGLDCNVDEVINHELSMGEQLDFNFQNTQNSYQGSDSPLDLIPTVVQSSQTSLSNSTLNRGQYTARTNPPSWVH